MVHGFKDKKGKFHPIKNYKRKTRYDKDEPFEVIITELPTQKQLIQMQRQPSAYHRRQIGIVTGGKALGTAPVQKIKNKGKLTKLGEKLKGKKYTSIGTPDTSKGKISTAIGGLKGAITEKGEGVQEEPAPFSGSKIVIDPRTGRINAKSGVLVDAFKLQELLRTKVKSPSVIALALFGAPLVALRQEKQMIVKRIVRRNS